MRLAGSDIEILFVEIEEDRRRFTAEIWLPDGADSVLVCAGAPGEAGTRLSAWSIAEQGWGVALIPVGQGAASDEVRRILTHAAQNLLPFFTRRSLTVAIGEAPARAAAAAA
jgi:hypothetical protein